MLKLAYSQPLQPTNIWELNSEDKSEYLVSLYEKIKNNAPNLIMDLFLFFRYRLLHQSIFALSTTFLQLANPFLLNWLLAYLDEKEESYRYYEKGFCIVLGLFLTTCLRTLVEGKALFIGRKMGFNTRTIIMNKIYTHVLNKYTAFIEVGKINNFLSIDSYEISETFCYVHYLYCLPIQIIFSVIFLFYVLGLVAIFPLSLIFIFVPINYWISKKWERVQKLLISKSDVRMKYINEMVNGIRIIKFFNWEQQFHNKIDLARNEELKALSQRYRLWVLSVIVYFLFPMVLCAFTLFAYTVVFGNRLTSTVAFTTLLIFKNLKDPIDMLPSIINSINQAKVSLARIQDFFQLSPDTPLLLENKSFGEDDLPLITFQNVDLVWNSNSDFILKNLSFTIPINRLTLIVGPTGSGKTTILMALLKGLEPSKGDVVVKIGANKMFMGSNIAYVAQTAWIQQASIKDNILFGSKYNTSRYNEVIQACQLQRDFSLLPNGDLTEVGERGVTLSGGQKQRVALARAFYSNAQLLILDDCLSAVDSHTAQSLFEQCFMASTFIKFRTIILVTHSVNLALTGAHHVLLLSKVGTLLFNGSSKEYLLKFEEQNQNIIEDNQIEDLIEEKSKIQDKLILDEGYNQGHVSWKIYKIYVNVTSGKSYWAFVLFLFALYQFLAITQDLWIKNWASSELRLNWYYIKWYSALIIVTVSIGGFRALLQYFGTIKASQRLHSRLLKNLLRASIRFYESTPSGRITNRFSKDIQSLDQELIYSFSILLGSFLAMISTLILISLYLPMFLMAAVVIIVMYGSISAYYISTSRELKRFEAVFRSPIYSFASETMQGSITIRAFGHQKRFIKENFTKY